MKYEIKDLGNAKLKIEAEIEAKEFDIFFESALKDLTKEAEMPGFRKGKVPEKIVEEKINPAGLLSEAAEMAIRDTWLKILKESKIDAISQPEVEIIKIAKGNPLVFNLNVEVLPKVELPDIRAIATKEPEKKVEITDKEVEESIAWLQQSRAKLSNKEGALEKGDLAEIAYIFISGPSDLPQGEQKDGFIIGKGHFIAGMEDALIGMKLGEEKNFKGEIVFGSDGKKKEPVEVHVKIDLVNRVELPEINDEFAKALGKFESLEALKADIKKGVTEEKQNVEKENRRATILEKIAEKTKVIVPEVLINREEEALFKNLKNRIISEMKMSFEQYLTQVKKTEEEVKKEFKKIAEQRVKIFLILNQIEKDEKIEAGEDEIDERIAEILKQYPDQEQAKKEIESSQTRLYIADEIRRGKIFKLLGC
ncbi:MAG: trigger factor [Candidatus Paceibacterota bacterium]|jgi:trigger factor